MFSNISSPVRWGAVLHKPMLVKDSKWHIFGITMNQSREVLLQKL